MANRLAVDLDDVMRVAREHLVLADTVSESLRQLTAGLALRGAPWGNDQPGRTFAESYLPALAELVAGLQTVTNGIRAQGENLAAAAQTLVNRDISDAAVVENSPSSTTGAQPVPDPTALTARPLAAESPHTTAGATDSAAPAAAGSDALPRSSATAPETGSRPQQPVPPDSLSPSGNRVRPSPGRPPRPQDRSRPPESPTRSPAPSPWETTNRGVQAPRTVGPVSAATTTQPVPAAPAPVPRGASVPPSPWSAPGNATAPGPGQLRPGSPAGEPESSPRGPQGNRRPEKTQKKAGSKLPEQVRLLTERHGIALPGFDDPDVDDAVRTEFAAALDDVLSRYPAIDLRAAAIAELPDDRVSTSMWNWEPGLAAPHPYTTRIVLAAAAARDPQRLAERVGAAVADDELVAGSEQRPVYSTIVRELGHALDVAGSFRARPAAQRALLASFLPTVSTENGGRATLDSYRHWRRSGLSGYAFDDRRLHPGRALAEAFTHVHLQGDSASAPARALHRLLVDAADPQRR